MIGRGSYRQRLDSQGQKDQLEDVACGSRCYGGLNVD